MAASKEFTAWLNLKLRELNTDETVFGSYISGILEGDETLDEKREALEGILSEILTENIEELLQTILDKWSENAPQQEAAPTTKALDIKVEEQLVKLLETTKVQAIVKERQYTEEEKRIREQILAQYSQTAISDDEYEAAQSDEEIEKHAGAASSSSGLERNTNFSDVVQLQKEKREQARSDAAAKKLKDKEDREKQKQLREEKKEKRKTVKGERRR